MAGARALPYKGRGSLTFLLDDIIFSWRQVWECLDTQAPGKGAILSVEQDAAELSAAHHLLELTCPHFLESTYRPTEQYFSCLVHYHTV